MKYAIDAAAPDQVDSDCVVVIVWDKGSLSEEADILDRACGRMLSKLTGSGDFKGKLADTYLLHSPGGCQARRILLLGGGEPRKLDAKKVSKMFKSGFNALHRLNGRSTHFAIASLHVGDRDSAWVAARLAQDGEESLYQYDTTKSRKAPAKHLRQVSQSPSPGDRRRNLEAAQKRGRIIGQGVNRARHLGDLPANICTPAYLAEQGRALAGKYKAITTQVLSEKQMARLGMGSLLSVAAGSSQEAKLIVMQYQGAKPESKPAVLVGKGITFDTGGISIKPGLAMDEMKFDMCGAASVIATMACVADLKLPINVVGIVAAAENMPGSSATRPGDIVISMSGKTIEILNTDAEGRLVLCDALTYAGRFKPRSVIDIATLTGAAVATFGATVSALLGNNDALAKSLLEHGEHCLDPAWQLPLGEEYQSMLDSNFADIANIGGPKAGTITAACFLSRFTEKYKWAHLDIAGSAWNSGTQKGATGRPVSLLVEYLSGLKS